MAGYEQNATIVMNAVPGMMTGITTLISGFASINQQFQDITSGISNGFGIVDAALISTGALVAKLGWDAAQAYGQFEQGMRVVQVVSNQGASAMEELSTAANQFSVQYRTDIDKITEGLQTLGRAGLNNAHEQTEVLQNGLQTAKLEGRELNTVLEEILQNTTLLGGDLRSSEFGEQSTYVNDLLVSTSMTAPITSHDISQTLQYSGGLAATAGANIDSEENKDILTDYMATIAAFAQKGVKGSLAGTALRAFLNKPATQDSSVREGLGMIKLKPEYLWEEDEERMKPISEQIRLINKQMNKLDVSKMDRLQIWSKIVGGKMGQQMMKLEPDDIQRLTTEIDKATSSEEMANKSMNTFSQNLKQVEEQGQVAFRGIGENVVRILNPILLVVGKIMEVLSNPIVNFGVFAGGLALVVEAGRRLWGVIKAVKDEFMLMRAMATEALQAITGGAAAAGAGVSQLGNIMIGGLSTGLSAETNRISILNQGLLTTKGLLADIQMQALGLSGGGKLIPGQRYGTSLPESAVGYETRQRELVDPITGYTSKVHERRLFHVFERNSRAYIDNINAIAEQKMNDFLAYAEKNNIPITSQHTNMDYWRKKAANEARDVGNGYVYMRGPWEGYNEGDEQFNQHEKYAHAVVASKSGEEPHALNEEEQKKAVEDAKKEVERRKNLGLRGRLKEDLSKKLNEFDEIGRPYVDSITNSFKGMGEAIKNKALGIKSFGQKIANMKLPKLPFEESDVSKFSRFRKQKLGYLNKKDVQSLIKGGYFDFFSDKQKEGLLNMPGKERSAYALKMLKYLGTRDDALGHIYNDLYKTERTLKTALSSFRKGVSNLPSTLSDFKNKITNFSIRDKTESVSTRFQNVFENRFVGLGNAIQRTISVINRARSFISTLPARIAAIPNKMGEGLQNALKTSFIGLGENIRGLVSNIRGVRDSIISTRESIRELGVNATEAAQKIRNLSAASIKQGIQDRLPSRGGIKSSISSILSGFGAKSIGAASKALGGLATVTSTTIGAVSTVTNALGGPLMVAMMAFSAIMSAITKKMEEYGEEVNDAKSQVKDAYSERNKAENDLKDIYTEQNPDATEEEIGGMYLNAYSNMREEMKDQNKWLEKISTDIKKPDRYAYDEEKDDGSLKKVEEEKDEEAELEESINENTSAIYTATAEISVALDKFVSKMNDTTWGLSGRASEITDKFGHFQDTLLGFSEGSSYTSEGGFLKTATQKDSKYPGYTEFPGLFLEDAFDTNGSLQGTMDRLFGADSNKYLGALNKGTKDFLTEMAKSSRAMGRAGNSRLQASMMNDKKSWQMGAKELAKYESKNKKSVGAQDTKNTRLENLIKKLQIDTGLSRIQVLQGMYLQQMQDMYTIAEQAMVPLIGQTAQATANTMMLGQQEFPFNQGTANYTYGTMEIAKAISAQLAVIAWAKAGEATRNAALADPDNALHQLAMDTDDGDQFMKEAIKREEGTDIGGPLRAVGQLGESVPDSNVGLSLIPGTAGILGRIKMLIGKESTEEYMESLGFGKQPFSKFKFNIGGGDLTAMNQILDTFGATTYTALGMPMNKAIEEAQKDREEKRNMGENYSGIYEYFAKMWGSKQMAERILGPYLASSLGEDDDSGSGGSGGGGGGGNSGDKDNTGTKKERVDLVLCNKKEIPKLNVNLFKKPPTFTVLNKNFKLRDVKINTQDKPKAIMASIKNAFIDVQKRSDPKIIQDEEAEYDPVGATDGNSVPSGSSTAKTDSKKSNN